MITVNTPTNTGNIDWSALAKILEQSSANGVNGTIQVNDDQSLTITVQDKDGVNHVTEMSFPILDEMGTMDPADAQNALNAIATTLQDTVSMMVALGDLSADQIQQLQDGVAQLQKDSKATQSSLITSGSGTSQFLLDVYSLMALMIEVAQKQRDSTRAIRLVENQQVQNSIQAQADMLAAAAMTCLVMGIISTTFSAAMSITTMAKQASGFRQQQQAGQQMSQLQSDLHSASMANNPTAAAKNFSSISANTPEAIKAQADVQQLQTDLETFKTQLATATENVNTTTQARDTSAATLRAKQDQQNPPATQEEIEAAQTDLTEKTTAMEAAKTEQSNLRRDFFTKLDTKVSDTRAKITLTESELQLSKDVAAGKAQVPEGQNPPREVAVLEEELKSLQAKDQYLTAFRTQAKSLYASDEMKAMDLMKAQHNYDIGLKALEHDQKFLTAQQMMNRWMGIQQISMTLGGLMSTVGQMVSEQQKAAGQVEQKGQVQHQEQLDQIKDLHAQALNLVQSIIQLLQAVLSAENESLMEAIRA